MGPLERGWASGDKLKVHTVKLDHLPRKRWRFIPIFPMHRPYLEAALSQPGNPADKLIADYKCTETNLTSRFRKLCKAAGIPIWPKPWFNLRSTRITELEDSRQFSEAALDAWFGTNTKEVRKKRYNQVAN